MLQFFLENNLTDETGFIVDGLESEQQMMGVIYRVRLLDFSLYLSNIHYSAVAG